MDSLGKEEIKKKASWNICIDNNDNNKLHCLIILANKLLAFFTFIFFIKIKNKKGINCVDIKFVPSETKARTFTQKLRNDYFYSDLVVLVIQAKLTTRTTLTSWLRNISSISSYKAHSITPKLPILGNGFDQYSKRKSVKRARKCPLREMNRVLFMPKTFFFTL